MGKDFWLWLGFDYSSIEIDGSPGSIPLDLNYDNVPAGAQGEYEVTSFGTTRRSSLGFLRLVVRYGYCFASQRPWSSW